MTKVETRTLNFFDRQIIRMIVSKYGLNEMDAIRTFLYSETYQMLIDPEMEIYKMSPRIVFDMWECEQITGAPYNSQYLRGDEDE